MNPQEKVLSAGAAALLVVAILSVSTPSAVCLSSAGCALAISIYLRYRGAFRDDNTPLVGAFLIGGSAMMVLAGLFLVSPLALLIVSGAILIPIFLFLLAFGVREKLRSYMRKLDRLFDDGKPPP
jgi:uncharacterized membrane protein